MLLGEGSSSAKSGVGDGFNPAGSVIEASEETDVTWGRQLTGGMEEIYMLTVEHVFEPLGFSDESKCFYSADTELTVKKLETHTSKSIDQSLDQSIDKLINQSN